MTDTISIILGTPEHGWLPVDFRYKDFHLKMDVSDAGNNPIAELYNTLTKSENNQPQQVIWYLEPAAYFFDFERKDQSIILTITETGDIHNDSATKKLLITITGNDKEIIEPFRTALRQFASRTYEEKHWPYNLEKEKIERL